MNINKLTTKRVLSFMAALTILMVPMLAGAQFDPVRESGSTNLSTNSVYSILVTFMRYALVILTILAVIGFIISGLIYITAGGAGKADTAQKWLQYSIMGIIVGLIGYIVIQLIDSLLKNNPATS
jgi:hypothetical protein